MGGGGRVMVWWWVWAWLGWRGLEGVAGYVCWEGAGSEADEAVEQGRSRSFSNRPCAVWLKRGYGTAHSRHYAQPHALCSAFPPHFQRWGPWCFVEGGDWEPCYPSCRPDPLCFRLASLPLAPNGYLGLRSRAADGRACLPWREDFGTGTGGLDGDRRCRVPHPRHRRRYSTFLQRPQDRELWRPMCQVARRSASSAAEEGRGQGAARELAPCFPVCEEVARCLPAALISSLAYQGSQATTTSGQRCLAWSDDSVQPVHTDIHHRRCRNMDGNLYSGPYCKTALVGLPLEPCLPVCEDMQWKVPLEELSQERMMLMEASDLADARCGAHHCVRGDKMLDYRGRCSHTVSGERCVHWALQQRDSSISARLLGVRRLWEAGNFCRNPDASPDGPWCFAEGRRGGRQPCFPPCSQLASHGSHANDSFWASEEAVEAVTERAETTLGPSTPAQPRPSLQEWLGSLGLEWDDEAGRRLGMALGILGGLLLLYLLLALANVCLYELCKGCCCIRAQLRIIKRTIEQEPPRPGSSAATNEAYVALVTQFKRLRNVARHTWSGGPKKGWEEFEALDIRQDVPDFRDSTSDETDSDEDSSGPSANLRSHSTSAHTPSHSLSPSPKTPPPKP